LENWFEVEFILLKVLRLQPSELDKLEFYRAEILMENLKAWNEKESENRKKQEDTETEKAPKFNQGSLMKDANKLMKGGGGNYAMPKMPNWGGFPKF
jgi:hypothetical protein